MFYKYILEIKNRIILIISSWVFIMFTCYYYKNILLFLLIKLNLKLYHLKSFYFISTNLADVFSVCLKLSYFFSNQFTFLLLIYHIVMFLAPSLFKSEYYLLKIYILVNFLTFILGLVVLHVFLLPFLWEFFLTTQTNSKIQIFFESRITEYYDFYTKIYFLMILITQICGLILINLFVIKKKIIFVLKSRKPIYVFFIVISTIITPPDIISQVIISSYFIIFYEFIVLNLFFKKHYFIKF